MAIKRVRFIERRRAVGLTQEELAALVGVDRSTVVRWEHVATEPQPLNRRGLAEALQVTAEELSEAEEKSSEQDQAPKTNTCGLTAVRLKGRRGRTLRSDQRSGRGQ